MKIVGDSSLDLTHRMKARQPVTLVPFSVRFEHETIVDHEDVDIDHFVKTMQASGSFQSACPSPNDFLEAFEGEEDVFCITITSKLSGSYNAAMLAKNLYEEAHPGKKKIHIIDSKSASTGPCLVYLKILELLEKKLGYGEIVQQITNYINDMHTMFISKSLDNLIKAGRMSNIKGFIAKALNIVPVMGARDGVIELVDKARGSKRAFAKLLDNMESLVRSFTDRVVAISHADNEEQALKLKQAIEKRFQPKAIHVLKMSALNTLYADYQGIIISF